MRNAFQNEVERQLFELLPKKEVNISVFCKVVQKQ